MWKFPFYKQYDEMDCGPTCLRIISKYYGKSFSLAYLRSIAGTDRLGTSLLSLSQSAEKLGFKTAGAKLTYDELLDYQPFPCVIFWRNKHYVVLYKIKKKVVYISDPAYGRLKYPLEEFLKYWLSDKEHGIVLTLTPTDTFEQLADQLDNESERGFLHILSYLKRYRKEFIQIILGLTASSLLQLALPFLTQSMVDTGIQNNDLPFVYIVLISQLTIFLGRTITEVFRNYLLLHVSTRINIHLLKDFFVKLMKLPLSYFDSRKIGDILQRINDHRRVESFLPSGTLNTLFSLSNLLLFSLVLLFYNALIFLVFLIGSILYITWILSFMKKRADIDYRLFAQHSVSQEKNYELIVGMQEIKLNNAEEAKRAQWEEIQINLFKVNLQSLTLKQIQSGGAITINEIKNIVISFMSAQLVMQGQLSFGIMLAISYIAGQLNSPILQLIEFIQSLQDAKLSTERINEIHNKQNEETTYTQKTDHPESGDITLKNISYRYFTSVNSPMVLNDISLRIPEKKVTAIVGSSGSGKTTLLKLLLKFYTPLVGSIKVGHTPLESITNHDWRARCGVVMQDGFIFNDSIYNNIIVDQTQIDQERFIRAVKAAKVDEFIRNMPMGFQTLIGANGLGLSAGQKQRILIARAIYKDPDILFFDEATSALDARNEREITENLTSIFANKTVVIVAHRLSTVRHADQIIVLHNGRITECGTHDELVRKRGDYYTLVSNQLELAN